MKNALYSLLALLLMASCSKEEEVITPPAPNKYTITITAEAGGSVSSPGGTYNEGSKITITATPDAQYLFKEWSDGSTTNPREITVTSNLTLSATFVKKTYPLAVTIEGEGTVQEEVIIQGSTSETEYNAGTTVRLTATPNEGWVFAGWSGDIESEELEIEVPIEKGTAVSALFKRDSFELNITIEGEGTVKEEVIVQPGQYDYETVVRLTAIPDEGWEFRKWLLNQVEYSDLSIEIEVTEEIDIYVEFYPCSSPEVIQYFKPSYEIFQIIHPYNLSQVNPNIFDYLHKYGTEKIIIDYNMDGYLDFVSYQNDYDQKDNRDLIKFFTGDCEGNLTLDETNSGKFEGLIHGRKILQGDYNNDGYPDLFLIGHGWDYHPFEGEYPVLLFSSPSGEMTEQRLIQYSEFFHGGSSGDFDNDGDLDVILNTMSQYENSFMFLQNDGAGNFSEINNYQSFDGSNYDAFLNSEMMDYNEDGFLDLILMNGKEETGNVGDSQITNSSLLLFGNGSDFSGQKLSIPWVDSWASVYDVEVFDIDQNGTKELILNRVNDNYEGWYVQIVELIDGVFVDNTEKFIESNTSLTGFWNVWLEVRDYDEDGIIELRNSIPKAISNESDRFKYVEWELVGEKFKRVE